MVGCFGWFTNSTTAPEAVFEIAFFNDACFSATACVYVPFRTDFQLEVFLSAVATAECLGVSASALRALAQFHMGDLRACLLALQVRVLDGSVLGKPSMVGRIDLIG